VKNLFFWRKNMLSVSFKSAARNFKTDSYWFRAPLAATICDMAHAISRGRNPSSVTGINPRTWWRDLLNDCSGTDYEGEECSVIFDMQETTMWCKHPDHFALYRAINIVNEYFCSVGWPKSPLTAGEKQSRHQAWLDRNLVYSFHDYDYHDDDCINYH
jgi:hypothetical protein